MDSETEGPLWAFACGLYDFADVKNQCLELQDVYGANVNIVLWLCWLHNSRLHVAKSALLQALQVVGGANHELLHGLRELRRDVRSCSSFTRVQEQLVRKHILSAELAIEKILLQRLQDLSARLPPVANDAETLSLSDYLDFLGMASADEIARDLLASSRGYWLARVGQPARQS